MSKIANKSVIEQILETKEELGALYDTDNIKVINQLCNRLADLTVNLGAQVSDAEKNWSILDDDYEHSLESKKIELIESGVGVGKAESLAKVALYDKKKETTKAKLNYNRLKRFLSRLDKMMESNKQYTSTVKSSNLKNV
jgi:hypothetical protein